jgi:hypothetical protein
MKKFMVKLGFFIAIQAALLAMVLLRSQPDQASNHYLYTFKDKIKLLEETPSPRIIFVGGSSLAFGLNSPLVKERLGRNPVNLGLHASIGLYPLLRAVEANLRADDVIVLAPEYAVLTAFPHCRQEIGVKAYKVWPGCKEFIQPDLDRSLEELVPPKSPLGQLADRVHDFRKRLTQDIESRLPRNACYFRNSFNQFGDHVAHHDVASRYQGKYTLPRINRRIFDEVAIRLDDFHRHCRSANASVYFTHPPVGAACMESRQDWVRDFEKLLARKISIPVITTVEMISFDKDGFFDSDQHLTEQAATIRTSIICQQLQKYHVSAASVSDGQLRYR